MTLDLNQLHVESFVTDDGSLELMRPPAGRTEEVILCAEQGGSATSQVNAARPAGVPLPTCTLTTR